MDRIFLDFSAKKLRQFTDRIEVCLGKLNEEQVWARGSANENAIGNLALHLSGNVRQWICASVGGRPFTRERDAEFAATGGVAPQDLTRRLREVVEEASSIIESLPAGRLTERVSVQGYEVSVLEAIYHVVEHFAMHTGQIIFATKIVTGEDLGFYGLRRAPVSGHAGQTP